MQSTLQVVVDAGSVLKLPDSWTMIEGAGFMEATLTAYLNIFQLGGAEKGKSVLIHGGGSGVGRYLAPPSCAIYAQRNDCSRFNYRSAAASMSMSISLQRR